MLRKSLDALMNLDSGIARQVPPADDEVDEINREMYLRISDRIRTDPEHALPLLSYLSASRHLERIADYATNIAEDLIYMIEGNIVRHGAEAPSGEEAGMADHST
jgi:phosphate transport system protein